MPVKSPRRPCRDRMCRSTQALNQEQLEDSNITTVANFLQQDAGQLAPFLRVCHDHCAELEGYGSSRVRVDHDFLSGECTVSDTTRCARCSGFFRQSLWLDQSGPPPVCNQCQMSNGCNFSQSKS